MFFFYDVTSTYMWMLMINETVFVSLITSCLFMVQVIKAGPSSEIYTGLFVIALSDLKVLQTQYQK